MTNARFGRDPINAVLLIDHEIGSTLWKEMALFRLPGGIGGLLLVPLSDGAAPLTIRGAAR